MFAEEEEEEVNATEDSPGLCAKALYDYQAGNLSIFIIWILISFYFFALQLMIPRLVSIQRIS